MEGLDEGSEDLTKRVYIIVAGVVEDGSFIGVLILCFRVLEDFSVFLLAELEVFLEAAYPVPESLEIKLHLTILFLSLDFLFDVVEVKLFLLDSHLLEL
jgi:hypothetical protein